MNAASSIPNQVTQPIQKQIDDTARLERLLGRQFAPVAPRSTYINDLGKRLSGQTEPILVQESSQNEIGFWQTLLMISAGIVSGVLLVIFGIRLVVSIVASRRINQKI